MTQSNDDLRFEDLGLSQPVLQALDLKGYNNPTPIQAQAIPPVLEGRDLMGIAQTGTGKTAAFMLPSIDRLREADKQTPFKSCRMLVLAPTRELAGQIAQNAKDYGALAGLKVHSIVGGTSVNKDRNKLHRGTDILVATPGRLLDLIDQKAFTLDKVEVLVLDEADQMLDLGFIHALRRISQLVPEDRQTLFFSATMPKQIQELVGKYCRNPVKVSVTPESTTAERIDQFLFMVQQDEKQTLLEMILSERHPVPGKFDETLRNLREIACTWYFNVPIGYDMLARELARDKVLAETFYSRLNMMFYAGAGMAQHTWDKLMKIGRETTGHDVLLATGLGSTETAPFALAWTDLEETAGNVGVPSRGLTLKLVPTDGKLELRLKGPSITPGYYGAPEKTAEVFDDEGFYCMGDALRPADPEDFSRGFYFDGRVAENFKLSTGTWVAVGAVRAKLVDDLSGLVRDAVIVGENESQLGALLWLSDVARQMPPDELKATLSERLTAAAKAATGSASPRASSRGWAAAMRDICRFPMKTPLVAGCCVTRGVYS